MSLAPLAHVLGLLALIPLALDGEAETANDTGLGVVSIASIVIGWAVLFALWWFVFRGRSRRRGKDSPD